MKYNHCNVVEGIIEFRYNGIAVCHITGHVGGGDIVTQVYDDKNPKDFKFDLEKIFEKKQEIVDANNKGNGELYPKCLGCLQLRESDTPQVINKQIYQIVLHHWTKCNSNCIYCYTNKDKKYFNKRKSYEVFPILKKMSDERYIKDRGMCVWAGGEISCLHEFDKIMKLFNKHNWVHLYNSSGIKYEKHVENHLKKGSCVITISTDCGNRELHKKIKQVDSFKVVWKNIKKYADAARTDDLVYTKYILLKGINDNEKSILEFLQMSKKSNVKYILMDIDNTWFIDTKSEIPKYINDLFYYTFQECTKIGLNMLLFNYAANLYAKGQWADKFWDKYVFNPTDILEKYNKQ